VNDAIKADTLAVKDGSVALGDANGDGRLERVLCGGVSTICFFLGDPSVTLPLFRRTWALLSTRRWRGSTITSTVFVIYVFSGWGHQARSDLVVF